MSLKKEWCLIASSPPWAATHPRRLLTFFCINWKQKQKGFLHINLWQNHCFSENNNKTFFFWKQSQNKSSLRSDSRGHFWLILICIDKMFAVKFKKILWSFIQWNNVRFPSFSFVNFVWFCFVYNSKFTLKLIRLVFNRTTMSLWSLWTCDSISPRIDLSEWKNISFIQLTPFSTETASLESQTG